MKQLKLKKNVCHVIIIAFIVLFILLILAILTVQIKTPSRLVIGGTKESSEYYRCKEWASQSNELFYLKNNLLEQFTDRKDFKDEIIFHERNAVYLCNFNTSFQNVKKFEKKYNLFQEENEQSKIITWNVATKLFRGARTVKLPSETTLNLMRSAKFKIIMLLQKADKESVNITICLKSNSAAVHRNK